MNERQIREESIRAMSPAQQKAVLGLYKRRKRWKRFRRFLWGLLLLYMGSIFILPVLAGYSILGGGTFVAVIIPLALLGVLLILCQLSLKRIRHKLSELNFD